MLNKNQTFPTFISEATFSNEWMPYPNIMPDRFNSISGPVAGAIVNIGAETSSPMNLQNTTVPIK